MSASRLNIIAFYTEGTSIVVVDSAGREHKADSPEEVWRMLWAIQGDKSLPASTINPSTAETEAVVEDESTYAMVAEHVGGMLHQSHGPLAARLAAGLIRNGGPRVISFLRRISRD